MKVRDRTGKLCVVSPPTKGFMIPLHEAGHIWMAYQDGLRLHGVTIALTSSRRQDGTVDYSSGCAAAYNRDKPETKEEIEAYVRLGLGGMAIELQHAIEVGEDSESYDTRGSNDDMEIAKQRCERFGLDYIKIVDGMCPIIRRDYHKIVALAGIIDKKKRMDGKQLYSAIKKVEEMFNDV